MNPACSTCTLSLFCRAHGFDDKASPWDLTYEICEYRRLAAKRGHLLVFPPEEGPLGLITMLDSKWKEFTKP